MPRRLFLLLAALVACGGQTSPPGPRANVSASAQAVPPAPSPRAKREPVVIAIVVDQLAAWVADTRLPLLPADANGGLTRLVREGTWAKKLVYPYAVTETAPGHAALHTGKLPSESGIFGNELPDANGPRRISILRDTATKIVTADGVKDHPSSSAVQLRADTVADRLRRARSDALIVSVSLKDRGAIISAGRQPTHVLWFDVGENAFVTSTAFAKTYPPWAKGIGDTKTIASLLPWQWDPLDRDWLAKSSDVTDDAPGEGDLDALGTKFPHVAKSNIAFRATPAADKATAALALAAVKAEWDPAKPTLVLVSFSANDVIGHVFGPDSWESWDALRRLDATLGELIDGLEKHVGSISVMLSGDHGTVPLPEATKSRAAHCQCPNGERVAPVAVTAELRAAVAKVMPGVDPKTVIVGIADPYVFLTRDARSFTAEDRAKVDKAVRDTLAKHRGVAQVFDVKTLTEKCPGALAKNGDDELTMVCRGWPRGAPNDTGAGDYYVLMTKGSFFDAEYVTGKGTNHGSLHPYDRTVPLLVRTADKRDAGTVIEQPVDFTVYSAIEASLLGLDPRSPKEILAAER